MGWRKKAGHKIIRGIINYQGGKKNVMDVRTHIVVITLPPVTKGALSGDIFC